MKTPDKKELVKTGRMQSADKQAAESDQNNEASFEAEKEFPEVDL